MIEGYVYKIIFADGCWYWGTSQYKGELPEKDGYYGSPRTNKAKWKEPHVKIVLKVFHDEQERLDYEGMCILPDLNNPKCLNEHSSRGFSKIVCKKGAQASAEKSRGIPRTEEVKEKIASKLKGKKLSPEHVRKLKEAKRPPITPEAISKSVESRKGYRHSTETIEKISKGNKGKVKSIELRARLSEAGKEFRWYTNGTECVKSKNHPGEGWKRGRILDWNTSRNAGMKWYHKNGIRKMFSEDPGDGWELGMPKPKGKRYYNNGSEHVLAYECPGESWVLGRLKRK